MTTEIFSYHLKIVGVYTPSLFPTNMITQMGSTAE